MHLFIAIFVAVFITSVDVKSIKDTNQCVCNLDFVDIKSSPTNPTNRYLNCTCNGQRLFYADNGQPITTAISKCNDFCGAKENNYCPQDINTIVPICPTHWLRFGQKCYYSPPNSEGTWDEARQTCQGLSARMVKIESREENSFVEAYLETLGGVNIFWLGGRRVANVMRWQDGMSIAYANWQPGEPNNLEGIQDCLAFVGKDGHPESERIPAWFGHEPAVWDDDYCSTHFMAICESNAIH